MGRTEKLPREKDGLWLTEDNKLIMMHGNMTIVSHKLTNYFLWLAQHQNKLKGLTVDCRTLLRDCNIKDTSFSRVLYEECKRVAKTQISIMDEDGNWKIRQIIPNMDYKDGVLSADLNPEIAPYIQGLTGNFTKSNLLVANKCSTYPSFRLYKICNSWLRTGYAYYSIDEWRQALGGTDKAYDKIYEFKRRIVVPAIKGVNKHTDLFVEAEYIKTGRKISHIKIHIQKKKESKLIENAEYVELDRGKTETKEPTTVFSLEERDTIKVMIADFKQSQKDAESYIKDYGVDYCKEQIAYVRQQHKEKGLRRIGGYFHKAITQDYAGKNLSLIEAARAEEAARHEKAGWNADVRKNGIIPASPDEEKQVQDILAEHQEIALLYRNMGMPDESIARWIEKYPEVLLFKVGLQKQQECGITVDLIDTVLKVNSQKQ